MSEGAVRLGVFLGLFAVLVALERWRPWAQPRPVGWRRWPGNLGLAVAGTVAIKLLLPVAAIGAAVWADSRGVGLLHWLALPRWVAIPAAFVLLDLLIYFQHRVTHAVPLLWRLHRVHHADPELDVSSALRFHPVEIVGSMLLKMAAVVALGAPPVAVLAFEVALNATAMFNHAAIALPPRLAAFLGWFVVTPDMHRIHHSERPAETNSCFGFCLPWWDWLFGTWRAAPAGTLVLGLPGWRATQEQALWRLLGQPLREKLPEKKEGGAGGSSLPRAATPAAAPAPASR